MDVNFVNKITEEFGTPTYVYDIRELKRRVRHIRNKLPNRLKICYAVKANTFLIKELENEVDRFEVCSPGEYEICKADKVNEKMILISGINKRKEEIEHVINGSNVRMFSIESMEQFELLKERKENIQLLLRLTSGNQFGINQSDIKEIISKVTNYPNIEIIGIQYFSGTQKTSIKVLTRELEKLDEFLKELREKYSFDAKELEFGTGFPVAYFENKEFDEETFFEEFSKIIDKLDYKGTIILEIGRSIVASCGTYITKIIDQKINKDQRYAIVDGGMNHIVYYGQSMAMKVPHMKIYPDRENSGQEKWNICGSLCTINDILIKQLDAKLEIGDLLEFENTGAYCSTEGISLFLSRDLPKVVKIKEDNSLELVRDTVNTYQFNH